METVNSNRNFKQGMYNSIVIVVVIALVILANMIVGELDIKIDLTKENVYTLTEDTVNLAKGLNDEITIYYLAKENDEYEVLQNVINQYDKLPNISVVWKDPELYPQFASQYTDSEITGNDVIVVDNDNEKSRFIPFNEMYLQDYEVNYTTYNYDYKYSLDAEGQITSAIQYVTAESYTKMYIVTAHGETMLEQKVAELVNKANVETEVFDAKSESEMPEDCDILFINGPVTDISSDELDMYKAYLDNGGKAILSVAYTTEDMTNYNELIAYYGVTVNNAIVCETEGNFLQNYPTYVLAGFDNVTEEISSDFTLENFVIAPVSKALSIIDSADLRSTLTVTSIAKSSEDSYAKVNPASEEVGKEDGDLDGPFDIVVQASDSYKDITSKVAILASPYMVKDDWVDYYTNSNVDLFINTIDWMSEGNTQSIAIPSRSLDSVYLEVPQEDATVWAILTIVIIPLAILAAGFVVWYLRRKH